MAKVSKVDTHAIADLVALLELECSPLACARLAGLLGYRITARPGRVELERAGMCAPYYTVERLARALVGEAKRLIGPR